MTPPAKAAAPGDAFPPTRHSLLAALHSPEKGTRERALEALASAYWRPVYRHLRLRWGGSREDAEDLTQELFARAAERGLFEGYDPSRARLRTWLRACADRLASSARRDARRLKRGGGASVVSLDFAAAEAELVAHPPADGLDPDEAFRREWVRSVFGMAVSRLRVECAASDRGAVRLALFERLDLRRAETGEAPSYAELAAERGIPVTQVTNHLAWARRRFRALVLDVLRDTSGSEEEYRAEARDLLGAAAP